MKTLVLTCEHASNNIPKQFEYLFNDFKDILNTHRGYDIGAFQIYKKFIPIAKKHFYYPYSRLLIEPNRSLKHKDLFSCVTKKLDKTTKQDLISMYYLPYRNKVQEEISRLVNAGQFVVHISVHTFTPVLDNVQRNTDIGLLYDPKNRIGKLISADLKKYIKAESNYYRVRFNYPYKGVSDGFVTYLRKIFEKSTYCGIEMEINQRFFYEDVSNLNRLINTLNESLLYLMEN